MLLKVQLHCFCVSELPLFGRHSERGKRYRVLKVVKIIEGILYVILNILYIVFLCRVVSVNSLLALVNHNEAAHIVCYALNFGDAAI